MDTWELIRSGLLNAAIPGAFGGLALFLWAVRSGSLPVKWRTRFVVEIMGGAVVAFFFPRPPLSGVNTIAWSFAVGLCWNSVIVTLKKRAPDIIRAVIGEKGKEDS